MDEVTADAGSETMAAHDVFTATNQQFDNIQREIAETHKLLGGRDDLEVLKTKYAEDDDVYQSKICKLRETYGDLRQTRPDGNCFYRAFAFGVCEHLLADMAEAQRFKELVNEIRTKAFGLGFPELTTGDFFDAVEELVTSIIGGYSITDLEDAFNDSGTSDYIVVCMRIIVSVELQSKADFYINFAEGYASIVDFCKKEVEPMYTDCDHLQVVALASILKVPARLLYMDRGGHGEVSAINFEEDAGAPKLTLLYRPGHYDVLYPR